MAVFCFLAGCIDKTPVIPPFCAGVEWAYAGIDGPDRWAELCTGFASCGGRAQSPVDLTAAVADPSLQALEMAYGNSATHIVNQGHTLQFNYAAGSTLVVNGQTYDLLQFHFHTGSEHQMDGLTYPLEVHLVHRSPSNGELAVVGVLFEVGAANPLLASVEAHYPAEQHQSHASASVYTVRDLLPASRGYFAYPGSLTTPPCSEGVTWLVMKERITASAAQVARIRSIIHQSNRPVQPLNGRTLKMFD